jgi:DNA-binding protein YbaB
MSSSAMHNMIEEAAKELRRQQARLATIRKKMDGTTTRVASKDKMITVTIGQAGGVESIEFKSQKFRQMAPAELGALLVETIRQAQAKSRERLYRAYQPLLPEGLGLSATGVITGKTTLEQMYEDTLRQVDDLVPGDGPVRTNGNGHANGNGRAHGHPGPNGNGQANGHSSPNGNGQANGHSSPNGNGQANGKDNPHG